MLLLLLLCNWQQHIRTSQKLHHSMVTRLAAAAAEQHMFHPSAPTAAATHPATSAAAAGVAPVAIDSTATIPTTKQLPI
jgi:hypothetical protein